MYFIHVDGRKRKGTIVNCQQCCNLIVCRADKPRKFCSVECQHATKRIRVSCAYCGKTFEKKKSALKNSRSGLFFCCREHKDLAQRIDSGILEIEHYKDGYTCYRERALLQYGEQCENCGFDDVRSIDVHHIDENRDNNDIDNLIVLCCNCHALVSRGFAEIRNRELIEL